MWLVFLVCLASTPKVDHLELARVLLRDGHAGRAAAALAEVDPSQKGLDVADYQRLLGLAAFELGRYGEAVTAFERALALREGAGTTWYALARSYYGLGDKHRAFTAAEMGHVRFPAERELERLRALLLLELGLAQEGMPAARRFLGRPRTSVKEALTFASVLAANRDLPHAAQLLEEALLRYPFNSEVRKQLARTYFESNRPLIAARVLHPVALEEPSSALLVAELYRRAGKIDQALRMNALVLDQKHKIRQRLDLLIEAERYTEVAALDERLSRLGLLGEERLLYALAYAHYVLGDRSRVEQLLGRVSNEEFVAKATAIREAMAICDDDVWQCD